VLLAVVIALLLVAPLTLVLALVLPAHAVHAAPANTAVTTLRNDNSHSGQYSTETILNTSNVNSSQFGKRVQYPVDGQMYAQPLYLPNLTVNGATHNVVFAATEGDSVYAFDADQQTTTPPAPLWKVNLLPAGATTVPNNDSAVTCGDLTPQNGITSTPVIDTASGTLFVVAYDLESGNYVYRLHALNVATGADKWPAMVITGSVPGTGTASSGGMITFNPGVERQRSALVLANGKVYVTFTSFCDNGNYHGWIFSYSYSTTAFTLANLYNDTPNGAQGGIWGGGAGLVADPSGANLYYMSGNGTMDANTGGADNGDSFVRLNATLQRQDFFSPFNQQCLSNGDQDLGAGGPLLIPSANELIGGGKEGKPYVVSTTNMGGYTADPNLVCGGTDATRTDIDKVVQELPSGAVVSLFSTPSFYNGPSGQFVYFSENGGPTSAYSFSGGKLSATPTSKTPETYGFTGGDAVVSSNGTASGTGVLWSMGPDSVLRAYDATNLGVELYNSSQNNSRDGVSGYTKFTSPVVTNGQVFMGLASSLAIFGVISSGPPPPPLPNGVKINAGGAAVSPFVADAYFGGGSTSATSHAIDLSGVTNPAPAAVYQSNRYGNFSYLVGGLPTSGSYTVRLHFAEEYWTTAGSRTFNVIINGTQVLTSFDILATAGAEYKAVVEQFTVAAPANGTVNIQFVTVKDNAQVNGVEIDTSNTTPPPTTPPPTTQPPPPPNGVQINSGGPAVSPFVADEFFAAGATASVTHAIDLTGVTSPAPMAVYQSNRYGNFTYTITGFTANSSHTVRLDFAEEYWTAAGSRIFNVVLNGTQVLTSFDILGTAGAEYKAVDEQFTTTANSSGQIVIQFVTVKDNAQINGIEIS
jgi:hypothetical protein